MPKSFGTPERKPRKPGSQPSGSTRGMLPERKPLPGLRQSPDPEELDLPEWAPKSGDGIGSASVRKPGQSTPRQELSDEDADEPEHIELGKRMVALMLDCVACYLISSVVASLPYLFMLMAVPLVIIPLQLVMVILLFSRDFFFEGRGIGKNLMGLRVVDIHTGDSPSLKQCLLRNVTLLAPFIVLQTVPFFLQFIPSQVGQFHLVWITEGLMSMIKTAGMVFVGVMLPLESYRAYSRADSLRLGDQLAGTTIVEAPMDFSSPIPRQS